MCWSRYNYRADDWFAEGRRTARRPHSDLVAGPGHLRVSDADRQRVIDQLKRHTSEGRLTLDEFEARVDETLTARTGSDLRVVLRELPPLDGAPRRHSSSRSGALAAWLPPAVVAVAVLTAVVLVVGHVVLWPVLVVAFFWFRGGSLFWRRHGERGRRPDGDDEVTFV
jgi:Domain of unknown function (DUF1707)